jgi:hypothetical protein
VIGQTGVVMRRRTATELIDLATALLRPDAGAMAKALLPIGVGVAACTGLAWLLDPWFGVAVGLLTCRLAQLPALLAASDRAAGRVPSLTAGRMFSGWAALLPGWVLYGLGYAVGSMLLVLPPWLWVRSLFLPEIAVLERPEGGASARVSALSANAMGEMFVTRLWQVALEGWAVLGTALTAEFVMASVLQVGEPFGSLWAGDASPFLVVGAFLAQPLVSALRFCSYLDVRTRNEGLDAWFLLWAAASAPEPG